MTAMPSLHIPKITMGDRMGASLREAEVSVNEMAEYLEVHRATVSSWVNDRNRPRPRDLKAFALRCGVPVQWLETGTAPAIEIAEAEACAARDSNPEPAD